VPVVVIFEDAHVRRSSVKHMTLQGIQYAFLYIPQPEDVIEIRNEGEQPIRVNAAARQSDALMVWILRHNSRQTPFGTSANCPSTGYSRQGTRTDRRARIISRVSSAHSSLSSQVPFS
jgi:hypothetical protein